MRKIDRKKPPSLAERAALAASLRSHPGAAKIPRARKNTASIEPIHLMRMAGHMLAHAQKKQRLHESKRDMTQQLIQGSGMSFERASAYSKQAYAGGQERAHHLRKLRSNRPSR